MQLKSFDLIRRLTVLEAFLIFHKPEQFFLMLSGYEGCVRYNLETPVEREQIYGLCVWFGCTPFQFLK
jgi:hypothetical protein